MHGQVQASDAAANSAARSRSEPVVFARGVGKRFVWRGSDVQALSDVSLEVRQGEVFALLGPNGAGKTTLLNILMGILTPDSGEVRVLGQDVLARGAPCARIGYASGEIRFHWALTPLDVLDLYATAYGLGRRERRSRVEGLLAEFGLESCARRKFDLLSTGERMRTVLAKALVNEPELAILDEPTIGLDPDGAIAIRREIARMNRERGVTVLLTSHYMREVEELASRIAFMRKGRIVDTGPASEVIARAMPGRTFVAVRADDRLAGELGRLGFERRGERHVRAVRAGEPLAELVARLAELGVGPSAVEIGGPDLEDYFVHMVEGDRHEAEQARVPAKA